MKEPTKYEQHANSQWYVTQEWKDWRKQILSNGAEKRNFSNKKKKPEGKSRYVTEQTHKENWKIVATYPNSEKRIYFCACQSGTGQPYNGCGAVAIQYTRGGPLTILVQSRFE